MTFSSSVSIAPPTETECLYFLTRYAFQHGFSIALWRLPESETKHLILSRKTASLKHDVIIETLPAGFIFAPYDRDKERMFFAAMYSFSFLNDKLNTGDTPLENDSAAWLRDHLLIEHDNNTGIPYSSPGLTPTITKENYIALVEKSISYIEQGAFEKVVPSRSKTVSLPPDFDMLKTFNSLCRAYPNAFISFVSSPETGSWMGATPEVLVSIEDQSVFKTVALAGTKAYEEGMNLKSVAWTQKEIEEQALVERYIISCFKKIRLREYKEHGPKTVIAGNLMHLKSDFTVDLKETNFPQLGSTMLQLLHPTSAVCGMPLDASLDFLKKNETYNREFYSGYLGPVDINKMIHLFVNLRCMKITNNQAVVYAGAGVTQYSTAEEEWMETEMKLNTLLKIIS